MSSPNFPRPDDVWEARRRENAAQAAFLDNPPTPAYDPPDDQDDPRVCARCRRSWGSRLCPPLPPHFTILNTKTGRYHSGGEYGETDCGLDATRDEFLWPM